MRKTPEAGHRWIYQKHLRPDGKRYFNGIIRRHYKNLEIEEEVSECEPQCDCFNCVSEELEWIYYLKNSMVCGFCELSPEFCDCWDIDI